MRRIHRILLTVLVTSALAVTAYELRPQRATATPITTVGAAATTTTTVDATATPAERAMAQRHIPGKSAWGAPPAGVNSGKPGTYVPRGFAPNFREMIVRDLGNVMDLRLGKDFPADKRKQIAQAQNDFWDENGPAVDAFQSGKISQPEFAERTHVAWSHVSERYAQILTPEEYERLFDVPAGSDLYYVVFHGGNEQPGMPVQVYENEAKSADIVHHAAPPPRDPTAPPADPGPMPPRVLPTKG